MSQENIKQPEWSREERKKALKELIVSVGDEENRRQFKEELEKIEAEEKGEGRE